LSAESSQAVHIINVGVTRVRSSNGGTPNGPSRTPPEPRAQPEPAEGPPEGPLAFIVSTDIELPAAYWDVVNGKVKIVLRP
jgi:hypothetical protein